MLTLALGIGANSAIFSVVNGVLLRSLPYPEPRELVGVYHAPEPGVRVVMSPANFRDVREQSGTLEEMAAFSRGGFTLTGSGDPVRLEGAKVSAGFFRDVLQIEPLLGRTFRPEENEPGRNHVVILSHGLWQQRFGSDPRIVGRIIQLNDNPYEVIGVMPEGFSYPAERALWTPLEYDESFMSDESRGAWYLSVIGRLRPGVSIEQAVTEVETIGRRLEAAYPETNADLGMTAFSLHEAMVGELRTTLLVLLGAVGFVLLIQSFARLQSVDPGVRSAGGVMALPLSGLSFQISFDVEGREPARPGEEPLMQIRAATPDYFRTMGIPVARGRVFTDADRAGTPQVVVISESAARQFFPDEEPIGQRITFGWSRGEDQPDVGGEVIGVVEDVKTFQLQEDATAMAYVPHAQVAMGGMDMVIRTGVPPLSLAGAVRREVHALDPTLPIDDLRTLDQLVAESVSQPRFYMLLLTIFAAVALVLAAIGIFGVMSYAVAQRTREIGIRIALGANPGSVLRLVVGRALVLAAGGVALGLLGAFVLTRLLESLLYGITATDPLTFLGVTVVLVGVAFLDSYLPARTATRVDPMIALRAE